MTDPTTRPGTGPSAEAVTRHDIGGRPHHPDDIETAAACAAMADVRTALLHLVRELRTNSAYSLNDVLEVVATGHSAMGIVLEDSIGYAQDLWPKTVPHLQEAHRLLVAGQTLIDRALRHIQLMPCR